MLDRVAQALKDWRLHAKALDDFREGESNLAEARRRADRFDTQAELYNKAATICI